MKFIDITGQKFGNLTVIKHVGYGNFKLKCDCGSVSVKKGYYLRKGRRLNCVDCDTRGNELEGKKFGKYTVIKRLKGGLWECQCDCGNIRKIGGSKLKDGNSTHCFECQYTGIDLTKRVIKMVYDDYWRRANKRGIPFEITPDQFKEFIFEDCIYCTATPSNLRESRGKYATKILYNGIDRIDNKKGYVLGNIVPSCKFCNTMKLDLSLEEFKEKISFLYHRMCTKDDRGYE